jgi:hypothetical protein
MSLRELLTRIVDVMPDGAAVLLPVAWLRVELSVSDTEPCTAVQVPPDTLFTIGEVARRFSRSQSAVRSWAEQGLFRGAFRLRGRAWRIPLSSVIAFEAAERQRKAVEQTVTLRGSERLSDWRRRAP